MAEKKASLIYAALDAHPDVYRVVPDKAARSRMNICFRITKGGDTDGAEKAFLKTAPRAASRASRATAASVASAPTTTTRSRSRVRSWLRSSRSLRRLSWGDTRSSWTCRYQGWTVG